MEWHVQYRAAGADHVAMYPGPETAIQAACRLLDEGIEVIGIGLLDDSIDSDQIARIYAMWKRLKPAG
jgi:hypothetical protein